MSPLKALLLMGLGIALAGCEFIHPPTAIDFDEDPVVVHAVVAAGAEQASVLVLRVTPEGYDPGRTYEYEPGLEPVSGAEVRLVAGGDTVALAEAPAGFPTCLGGFSSPYGDESQPPARRGCYAARLPFAIRSGTPYRLLIRLADGRQIEGEAVPPAPLAGVALDPEGPVLVEMRQSNTDFPGRVGVRFQASAEVAGVGLAIRPVAAFVDGAWATDVQCGLWAPAVMASAAATTAVLPIYSLGCSRGDGASRRSVVPDSVHARLFVTAYDSAFVRYQAVMQQSQARPDAAAQGISGALGLFAGEATLERQITLVPVQ